MSLISNVPARLPQYYQWHSDKGNTRIFQFYSVQEIIGGYSDLGAWGIGALETLVRNLLGKPYIIFEFRGKIFVSSNYIFVFLQKSVKISQSIHTKHYYKMTHETFSVFETNLKQFFLYFP